jgi:phage terminase large subunit-like protein
MSINWQKTISKFNGQWCVAGVDLSSVSDFTCAAYMIPRSDDREFVDLLLQTWCPEARLYDKKNKYRDQYQSWAKQGFLEVTDGDVVDYDHVRQSIVDNSKIVKIGLIGVDVKFQGQDFCNRLEQDLGHTEKDPKVIACYNTAAKIGPVCLEFERRLLKKKINHGGNPVLRFAIDSVAMRAADIDGNQKPDKDKSQAKIDPVIASLYALDRLIRSKPPHKIIMPVAL